ncbi:MAG: ABC transporter ATP-binding protein [Planctomycetota bacterium]|nr:MAG: ABC transporter ATP-binding protein [Planctomycetota bacterium]
MSEELIRAEGVTKTYGSGETATRVLHGIDLALRAGELTLVMGPSGSGKTTLLSILGCLLKPSSGRVVLEGVDVGAQTEATLPELRRRRIGFVFQAFNLFEALTALENVEVSLRLAGLGARDARRRAHELLARVGLSDRAHHLPENLSGGQKQRVAIARALGSPGRLLLADEPTGALDGKNGRRVMELLRAAADDGCAVVVVTHDRRLEGFADRLVSLEDGRIADDRSLGPTPASSSTRKVCRDRA